MNFDGEKNVQIVKRKNQQILLGRSNLQFQILEPKYFGLKSTEVRKSKTTKSTNLQKRKMLQN